MRTGSRAKGRMNPLQYRIPLQRIQGTRQTAAAYRSTWSGQP